MKIENINTLTAKQLNPELMSDKSLHKHFKEWNIGHACKKILKNVNKDEKEAFKSAICEAFIGATKYNAENVSNKQPCA